MGEAPGVDGLVYLTAHESAAPGDFVLAKLEGAGPFDFYGSIIASELAAVG